MDKLRQCYDTLGVAPGASWQQIKQAYKDSGILIVLKTIQGLNRKQ
ncbi:MAG: hypothetical protein J0665_11385 [Deltaproteobacteria bacterium]|nr:hypothetical protein [Deltaproteobacteria bacterium]